MNTDYNKTTDFHQTTIKLTGHNSRKHIVRFPSCNHYHQHTHCQHNSDKYYTNGRQAQYTIGQDA